MTKVKLTITESKCRCGYFKKGQEFIVEDLCPPLCHELWNNIYPSVYALQNGASLDYGEGRAKVFDAKCPDEGRVCIHGEVIDQQIQVCRDDLIVSWNPKQNFRIFSNRWRSLSPRNGQPRMSTNKKTFL